MTLFSTIFFKEEEAILGRQPLVAAMELQVTLAEVLLMAHFRQASPQIEMLIGLKPSK